MARPLCELLQVSIPKVLTELLRRISCSRIVLRGIMFRSRGQCKSTLAFSRRPVSSGKADVGELDFGFAIHRLYTDERVNTSSRTNDIASQFAANSSFG